MNTLEQEAKDMAREERAFARSQRAKAKALARKARLDLRAYNISFERRWVVQGQKLIKAGNGSEEFDLKGAEAFIETSPVEAPSRGCVLLGAVLGGPIGALIGALLGGNAEEMINVVVCLADGEILDIPSREENRLSAKIFVNAVNNVGAYKG